MSDTDLRQKEDNAVLDELAKDFSPEEKGAFDQLADNDPSGGFYKPEKNKGRQTGSKGMRNLLIGIVGGVTVGGGIWGAALIAGPLQWIQFSKLIQKFHGSENTSITDNRYGKLIRYARYRNRPQQRRLGLIGNQITQSIDAKMAQVGLAFEFNEAGTQTGIRVTDPDKGGMRRMQEQGFEPRNDGKGFFFDIDQTSRFRTNNRAIRGLNSAGLVSANHGGRAGAIQTRVQNIRSNATFRFLGRLDSRLAEVEGDIRAKYRQKWQDFIKRGADADGRIRTTYDEEVPDEANQDPAAEDESRRAAESLQESANAGGDAEGMSKANAVEADIRRKLTRGDAALIAVTAVCIANSIADGWDDNVYTSVILPSIRISTGVQVMGDQFQDFQHQDFEIIEASVRSETLYDEETKTSWSAAQSIQTNLGNTPDGPPQDLSTKVDQTQNPILAAIGGAPALNGVCSVAGNPLVGIGISFFTRSSGVGFIADLGSDYFLTRAAAPLIAQVARWVALESIPADIAGAQLGYIADQGGLLMNNDTAMSFGGVALSNIQASAWKEALHEQEQVQYANLSTTEKLFSLDYTDSMASRFVRTDMASNPKGAVQSMATSLFTVFGSLGNSTVSLLTSDAQAQSPASYDYGIPKYGFSLEDLEDEAYEDPYVNEAELFNQIQANKQAEAACESQTERSRWFAECEKIQDGQYSSIAELNSGDSDYGSSEGDGNSGTGTDGDNKANGEACFATSVSANGSLTFGDSINYRKMPEQCKEQRGQDFMRYRFYVLDLNVGHAAACYAGEAESCEMLGQSAPAQQESTARSGPVIGNTVDVECAPGTIDEGEYDGYSQGEKYRIRLCAIPGFPSRSNEDNGEVRVNSTVSQNWLDLFTAAEGDGIDLTASGSFRTMERQEYFYNCYQTGSCNGGNEAARPGYSNHQMGLAVDIDINPSGRDPSLTTCQSNPSAYPVYEWLAANASNYGLSAGVQSECWHWSSTGN